VKGVDGNVRWSEHKNGPWSDVKACQHTVQKCRWYDFDGGTIVLDDGNTLGPLTGKVHARSRRTGDPPGHLIPGGLFFEVAESSGLLTVETDSEHFLSILTPQTGTGCPIPEPSTLLLFGCGALGFIGYGFRRWKQNRKEK